MKFYEKYDKVLIGVISGFAFPFFIGITVFLFSSGHQSLHSYLLRVADSNIITHSISLCVFPNILIFMLYNRLDMLQATRGVLAVTIAWAVIVFAVKFLG